MPKPFIHVTNTLLKDAPFFTRTISAKEKPYTEEFLTASLLCLSALSFQLQL